MNTKPKILFLDIETSPTLAHVWSLFKTTVGLNQIVEDWSILSYCCKWEGGTSIYYNDTSQEEDVNDDSKLLLELHSALDAADIVVAHNGRRFDCKKINARFLMIGLPPPSKYDVVDTLEVAKRHFAFTSNKLEYLTDRLCKKFKKLKHGKFPGHQLWVQCLKGNPEAWAEMKEYNINDVLSLEELFNILRPWISTLNYGAFNDDKDIAVCPKCGSADLVARGTRRTTSGEYQRYRCNHCSGWSQSRFKVNNKGNNKNVLKGS